ncbi:glycerol kinase GlpK [Neptunicella sp.]|uniref:glycerol kinase GlpK n=1 Tax=Neptunicella sp. TaxID=2125986 RepID=UPI003F69386C
MTTKYILAIDQGTTSSRAILFDQTGQIKGIAQQDFSQYYPHSGWVEHEPDDIYSSVLATCRQVMAEQQVSAEQIAAIGVTNQRETTLVWDKTTGKPIYRAIVWQDRRTADYCQQLSTPETEAQLQAKTGLLLDPYFSATKIRWILDNVPNARQQAEAGQLAFGTVDSYLIWQLTGGKQHRTDATNASRTLLFNIHQQQWDDELLALFDIPASMLPEVMDSADEFGITQQSILGAAIPILGVAGDQQAALFGHACFSEGMAKSTYGTGGFVMLNTGDKALKSNNRLLTTVAYRLKGKTTYAIEGSIFMAGGIIKWLVENMQLIPSAKETANMAQQVPLEHGVYLVPSFTGLGAPHWDPDARGAILGLTRDSRKEHIASAALQSVAYQSKDLQKAMQLDGLRPTTLRVDGGMVNNDWFLDFLSNMLGAVVERPQITETTALGAAYLAGIQAGIFDFEQLSALWHCEQSFSPSMSAEQRNKLYNGWLDAVQRVKS